MSKKEQRGRAPEPAGQRIYELEVSLFSGPVTEEFAEANPVVSRTIQIRGDQTLARLHDAIFDAFDRWENHMYEFQVGGKAPMDPNARRYVLSIDGDPVADPAGEVARTRLDALNLTTGDTFGYWFDFGDDWWHQVSVVAIHDGPGGGKYPRVKAKVGESPPQYADWDEEDDDEDEDCEEE